MVSLKTVMPFERSADNGDEFLGKDSFKERNNKKMKKKLVMVLMAVMVADSSTGWLCQKGATTDSSVSAEEEKDVEIPAKDY